MNVFLTYFINIFNRFNVNVSEKNGTVGRLHNCRVSWSASGPGRGIQVRNHGGNNQGGEETNMPSLPRAWPAG